MLRGMRTEIRVGAKLLLWKHVRELCFFRGHFCGSLYHFEALFGPRHLDYPGHIRGGIAGGQSVGFPTKQSHLD